MYSAPLREEALPHQREREEWARRLREGQGETLPRDETRRSAQGLSGDAALIGLILFLLSDRTKSDGFLLCILLYLLFSG